jgi:hypothetical protein
VCVCVGTSEHVLLQSCRYILLLNRSLRMYDQECMPITICENMFSYSFICMYE